MGVRDFEGVSDQRKAAHKRRLDAWALLRAGRAHSKGAMYIGGYAIECKLKSVAMETFRCRTLSQLGKKLKIDDNAVYTHGLEALAILLPLYSTLKRSAVWRDFAAEVNRWRPSWRYDPNDAEVSAAESFLESVDRLYHLSLAGYEQLLGVPMPQARRRPKTARARSRDQVKRLVHEAFRKHFPEDTVDVSDGYRENIHVMVVSREFDRMREREKQDVMWKIIDETDLSEDEKGLISLVFPVSPAEIK